MAYREGPVAGSIVALLILVVIYLISLFSPLSPRATDSIPFITGDSSSVAIELAGDCINNRGIYFLPKGTTVADFLGGMKGELPLECGSESVLFRLMQGWQADATRPGSSGLEDSSPFSVPQLKVSGNPAEGILLTGSSLLVSRGNGVPLQFILKEMLAAKKIALGLPIDINRASGDDLKLIPGIGDKTASQIIALREEVGKIKDLDELMKIKGIKKKRLLQLKKYFCVATGSKK